MESAAGKSEGSEAWGAVVDASPHGISQQLAASDVSIGIKASGAPSPVGRVTSLPAVGSPDAAALRTSGLGYQETDLANVGITEGVGGPTIEEEARGDETIRDGEGTEGSEDESDLISMDESSGGGWSRRSGWGGQEEWEEEEEAEEVVWSDGASESSYGGHADATESEDDYSDSFEDEEEDEDEEDEDEEEEEEEGGEKEGGVRRAYDLAVERMLSLSIRKRD